MLLRLCLLLACVIILCNAAALPNSTISVVPYNNATSVVLHKNEKRVIESICGAAVYDTAVKVLKYSWNLGMSETKNLANACMDTIIWSTPKCSLSRSRQYSTSVGTLKKCYCAFGIGTEWNIEDFLYLERSVAMREINRQINGGNWFGAANIEGNCGDPKRYFSISVSCAADSAKDRVKLCQAGTSSPLENLVSTVTATGSMVDRDQPPAPCETRPPYCRTASKPT